MENIFQLKFLDINELKSTNLHIEPMGETKYKTFNQILNYIKLSINTEIKGKWKKNFNIKYFPENISLMEEFYNKKYIRFENGIIKIPLFYRNNEFVNLIRQNKQKIKNFEIMVEIKLVDDALFIMELQT